MTNRKGWDWNYKDENKKVKIKWWTPMQMPPLAITMKTWDKRVEIWMWKKRNWGPKPIIPREG